MVKGYVDSAWGQVHHHRAGERGPWVVLLHESPRSAMVYRSVLPRLAARTRAVALDTPGYGASDGPPEPGLPLGAYAARLLEALDALGVEEFVPVGMKTGSALGTELALQAGPARVRRAVLYPPDHHDPARAEHRARTWAPPIEPAADGAHLQRLWDKYLGIYGPSSPRDLTESVGEILTNLDGYAGVYPAAFRYDSAAGLRRLVASGCSVLLFRPRGARMTADEPVEFADVPGTAVVEFPVTGHFATRMPAEFAEHVLEFLDRTT